MDFNEHKKPEQNYGQFLSKLVLRLTQLEPGIYGTDPVDIFASDLVVKMGDKNYIFIWMEEADPTEPDDIVLNNAYLSDVKCDYGNDACISVENIDFTEYKI